eukprot:gnl/TRDRNA2_/TRDRNA2_134591_c0_seq3.p1 gnl/TRDRNA2_/TRDRNA2_134591_c0~~gnl/TRDRNA2_/TRDRNA2_134591_c0_seq3.p1  ORF type:complete len:109 (-),score=5.37 gnl/TRDRNA2_/TRDRNA2_134591_c0_seq3:612-938(-)
MASSTSVCLARIWAFWFLPMFIVAVGGFTPSVSVLAVSVVASLSECCIWGVAKLTDSRWVVRRRLLPFRARFVLCWILQITLFTFSISSQFDSVGLARAANTSFLGKT